MRVRLALSTLAMLLAAHGAANGATIPIADARDLPLGTEVTVQGVVTVPSAAFTSSTFDRGFALQDATAGIYVSTSFDSGLNLLVRVRVTGTLDDDGFGQLVVRPAADADVVKLSGAFPPRATDVATGDVGEDTEGRLIEIEGTITRGPTNDLPFGYSVFIDDGSGETQVFIPASTGVNPFRLPYIEPGREIRVRGFSAQFETQYEVLPRHVGDVLPAF
jgi:DNA/RNA endonuclease YhcR with UshA esterase domain